MAFSSSSSLSATPNVTPLIDVLLVLLIIFMTVVPLSARGLESVLPETAKAAAVVNQDVPLLLQVKVPSKAGYPVVYRLNGNDVDAHHLRNLLRQVQAHSTTRAIFIGGDPQLDYQPVVTAISEAQQAGFRSIGLLPRAAVSLR